MRRLWLVIALAACSNPARSPDAREPDAPADAPEDAPADAPSGSARWNGGYEPSPRDYNLELGVLAVSVGLVAGPVGARRRRRRRDV
jgi:hypothetical protein